MTSRWEEIKSFIICDWLNFGSYDLSLGVTPRVWYTTKELFTESGALSKNKEIFLDYPGGLNARLQSISTESTEKKALRQAWGLGLHNNAGATRKMKKKWIPRACWISVETASSAETPLRGAACPHRALILGAFCSEPGSNLLSQRFWILETGRR